MQPTIAKPEVIYEIQKDFVAVDVWGDFVPDDKNPVSGISELGIRWEGRHTFLGALQIPDYLREPVYCALSLHESAYWKMKMFGDVIPETENQREVKEFSYGRIEVNHIEALRFILEEAGYNNQEEPKTQRISSGELFSPNQGIQELAGQTLEVPDTNKVDLGQVCSYVAHKMRAEIMKRTGLSGGEGFNRVLLNNLFQIIERKRREYAQDNYQPRKERDLAALKKKLYAEQDIALSETLIKPLDQL